MSQIFVWLMMVLYDDHSNHQDVMIPVMHQVHCTYFTIEAMTTVYHNIVTI